MRTSPEVRALRDVLGFIVQRECPNSEGPYAEPCEGMMDIGRYVRDRLAEAEAS